MARIAVVTDTPGWFDPHGEALAATLRQEGHEAVFVRDVREAPEGDMAFHLSCLKLCPPEALALNALNLVVHASDLPKGRGFSPLVWQVLEGRNDIPVCLIEAAEAADAGPVRLRDALTFQGCELNDEMREALGRKVVEMCLRFARAPDAYPPAEQVGEPSWYARRRPEDSRLDPNRTLADQFDLLRVVDNDRYPAFFEHRGRRFILRIEDAGAAG
ncbi:hypothetical protein Q0812_00705 [Brevundimonas sp. 2R-24]|uniref:Methionyl-tRNA formyltransferase n=1 Tax=Peiella sedimenti TaxID=3061083 RepID=A0ABT8SIY3_9CAUL|nr:hypothetical protein [Caulobacteraceae bacterium XZ-24]